MSSPVPLSSPQSSPSARHLLDSTRRVRPPRESRFNLRLFERPIQALTHYSPFTLRDTPVSYESKRKQTESLRRRRLKWAIVNAVLTVVVVAGAIVDNELGFKERISQLQSNAIRVLIISISLLQAAIVVKTAQIQLQWRILQGRLHANSTLYSASLLHDRPNALLLIGQIAHLCICMPPWLDYTLQVYHSSKAYSLPVSNLVTIAVLVRVLYLYNCLYAWSPYHSQRSQFYL